MQGILLIFFLSPIITLSIHGEEEKKQIEKDPPGYFIRQIDANEGYRNTTLFLNFLNNMGTYNADFSKIVEVPLCGKIRGHLRIMKLNWKGPLGEIDPNDNSFLYTIFIDGIQLSKEEYERFSHLEVNFYGSMKWEKTQAENIDANKAEEESSCECINLLQVNGNLPKPLSSHSLGSQTYSDGQGLGKLHTAVALNKIGYRSEIISCLFIPSEL